MFKPLPNPSLASVHKEIKWLVVYKFSVMTVGKFKASLVLNTFEYFGLQLGFISIFQVITIVP